MIRVFLTRMLYKCLDNILGHYHLIQLSRINTETKLRGLNQKITRYQGKLIKLKLKSHRENKGFKESNSKRD